LLIAVLMDIVCRCNTLDKKKIHGMSIIFK